MQFGLIEMWESMAALPRAVAILLIALSIVSLYRLIERLIVFSKARSKSKVVAPKLTNLLKQGKVQEALNLSTKKEYSRSHLARVTAAGIRHFMEGKESNLSMEEQIETAQRGTDRASTVFTQEMKKGLSTLGTIATTAPFIGLFGTIFGIINAFRGMALTGSGGIGAVASGIAEALIATALGIGVAIIAFWCFNYLNQKIDVIDGEMSNTSSEIMDYFVQKEQKGS
ncbi:MotA/TolQ/ExbB proton channel family protein [bacterium]|nr:MotA/TolQ/ExbB proton channel family protein [bacterium]